LFLNKINSTNQQLWKNDKMVKEWEFELHNQPNSNSKSQIELLLNNHKKAEQSKAENKEKTQNERQFAQNFVTASILKPQAVRQYVPLYPSVEVVPPLAQLPQLPIQGPLPEPNLPASNLAPPVAQLIVSQSGPYAIQQKTISNTGNF
jgi:hypothetical protein